MAYLAPEDTDDVSQILGLATNASQQDKLLLQAKLAAALRDKGLPGGQMAGKLYIPPNPLDTAMGIYDHLSGIMDSQKLGTEGAALDADRLRRLGLFAKKLNLGGGMPSATEGDTSSGGGGDLAE